MLHIQKKGMTNAATWKQLPRPSGVGSKGQNSTFSENGHVAY